MTRFQQQAGDLGSLAPALPTSREAHQQERGVLGILRGLAPRRLLGELEAELVAELQANRLLELAGRPSLPIPVELITELPRIVVQRDYDLPTSAMAKWQGGRWLIALNGAEPQTRLRFSLGHELKHVIDHRHVEQLYSSQAQAEAAADYFSACLWMPKREVKSAWGDGVQQLVDLARLFQVSPAAMARRLQHLGLRSVERRDVRQVSAPAKQQTRYYRTSTPVGASR